MKVLLISHEFPPYVGGAGNVSLDLAKGLVSIGREVLLMKGDFGDPQKIESVNSELDELGISYEAFPFSSKSWFLKWPRYIKDFITRHYKEGDRILINNYSSFLACYSIREFLRDKKYSVVLHGKEVDYIFGDLSLGNFVKRSLYKKEKLQRFLRESEFVFSVSTYFADYIAENYKLDSIPILNGIDVSIGESLRLKRAQKSSEVVSVLSVGRVIQVKGYDVACEALKELHKEGVKLKWTIVGSGEYLGELKDLVNGDPTFAESVTFKGALSKESIYEELVQTDIFLLPSRLPETFGLVFTEAMLAGAIAVGPDIGGVIDFLEHEKNGFITSHIDSKKVVDTLRLVLAMRENWESISKNAFDTVVEKCSYTKMAKEYSKYLYS